VTETVRAAPARWVRAWGPATLWLAVLFVLSHQPGEAVPSWWSVPDVLAAAGLALAMLDEWHQS